MVAAYVGTPATCAATLWLPSPQQPRVADNAAGVPMHIQQGTMRHVEQAGTLTMHSKLQLGNI